MNLDEMGALLRQERERKGISLENAATAIKISKKYLIALEEGRTDDLPHPVYAKGFVKNYARLLDLDPEGCGEVLARYYDVDDNHLRDAPRYEVKESSPTILERGGAGFKPSLWLGVPVVVLFCGLVWFFFSSSLLKSFSFDWVSQIFTKSEAPSEPEPVKSEPAKPAAASKSEQGKPGSKSESGTGASDSAKTAGGDASAPVQRDLLALTPAGQPKGASAGEPAQSGEGTLSQVAAEAQFAVKGNQVVEVNAGQPVKLEVTDDSGQSRSFSLIKGQRLTLRFQTKLGVRFISAPSVSVKLNGKDYPLEGGKADGRSLQFP